MRKLKKGFTIIELVIVIAVIAILTAVLVPTFISLSKKGKDTLDKNIVTNANIQLAASESLEGKNRSMSEAVEDVDQIGYHMSTVQTNNGNMIVWDQVNDRFVLLDKDGNVILKDERTNVPSDQNKLFYPIEKLSDRGDFKFAIFAKVNYEGPTSFTSATSFDAGEEKGIESISYEFTSNSEVLVVTNSEDTTLNVKAPNADFKHVGLCGKIDIEEVADDSFNDHGHVGYVEIESGHYIADEGSNIKAVYATSDSAKVDKLNGGQIENAYGADLDYSETNSKGNVELQYLDYEENHVDIEEQAVEDLKNDINPPEPVQERVVINNENYLTVFAANPDNSFYKLGENLDLSATWFIRLNSLNVDTIDIDLDGYKIYASVDFQDSFIDFQTGTLKLSNGTIEFNNTPASEYDTVYGIVGGNFNLELNYINFTGSNNFRAGVYMGSAVVKCLDSNLNNGWISVSSGTITFDCVGEFKVAGFFKYIPDLNPTVTTTSEYEIKNVGSYVNIDGMEGYKTFTIGRKS